MPDSTNAPPPFDLRKEQWIGVLRLDGTPDELSLCDVLMQAHELRAVRDPMPTVECGLLRVLVAAVLDIFQPRDTRDLAELLEAKRFDETKITAYFEMHANRFDLFHPQWPFLQCVMDEGKEQSTAGLLAMIPSGTNIRHFHHAHENEFGVCPAMAARLLITLSAFAQGNQCGKGSPSINGAPPFYVLLDGDNLFQTLLLNSPVQMSGLPLAAAKVSNDAPTWRLSEPIIKQDKMESGLMESLTWRPRRVSLKAGAEGTCAITGRVSTNLVRSLKTIAAWSTRIENWRDPHVAYCIRANARTVLRPQEFRPIWQDTGPLALLCEGDYQSSDGKKLRFERPAVVSQFAALVNGGVLPDNQPLNLIVYGIRTEDAKVFEWYRGVLRLPQPLVLQHDFASRAQGELDKAKTVANSLRSAVMLAHPRSNRAKNEAERKGKQWTANFDDAELRSLVVRTQRAFWNALEPRFLGEADSLLEDLAQLKGASVENLELRCRRWRETVRNVGWAALNDAINDLDGDADALERQVVARNAFAASVRGALELDAAQTDKKKAAKPQKGA